MTESARTRLTGPIRSVGVVYREHSDELLGIIDRLLSWASRHGISTNVEEAAGRTPGRGLDLSETPVDLMIALGGDGTFLRAARLTVGTQTPVLGVNLGRLGFLTAFPDERLEEGLDEVIGGGAFLEQRYRLHARIEADGQLVGESFYALNDVVVHTQGAARVTPISIEIGEGPDIETPGAFEPVGSFAADGVIVSTPTGSTAYSMSAGGPIIQPEVDASVVTPICPHSLAVRPLVVPGHRTLRVGSLDQDGRHQVTVDGQVVHAVAPGEHVVVGRDPRPISLVRLPGQTFFETMRTKLNWAARLPERT